MMQSKTTTIACPDCNTPILLEINQLLQGGKFTCSTCNASIGISLDSKNIVEKAVKSFEKTKL